MLDQKIRICLKSYNPETLNRSCNKIIDTLEQNGGKSSGIIPLPTKRKKYCVLRSPHVDKKSREQFEIRIHKRILDVTAPSTEAFNALIKLDLESGVDVEVKL